MESFINEGSTYKMAELILHNGACGRLKHGWSKALLRSLEENNLMEVANACRLGELSCIVLFKPPSRFLNYTVIYQIEFSTKRNIIKNIMLDLKKKAMTNLDC